MREGTDEIVGATVVASHAGDLISHITAAMVNGIGLGGLAKVIHPYPTQAEAIRKTADLYRRSRLTPLVRSVLEKWFALWRWIAAGGAAEARAPEPRTFRRGRSRVKQAIRPRGPQFPETHFGHLRIVEKELHQNMKSINV